MNINCLKTNKDIIQRERKHIVKHLNSLAKKVNNIYIFDPFEQFCDKKSCYTKKDNKFLYEDDNHINEEGAIWISNDLLSMISKINPQKSNANN